MWLLGLVEPTIGFEPMTPTVGEGKIYPVKEVKPPQIPKDLKLRVEKSERQLILFLQFSMSNVKSHDTLVSLCLPSLNSGMGWVMLFGIPMSSIVEQWYGVGDVIFLLWFKRSLPYYYTKFIEICIMLCANHGPCVSGAYNTKVTARSGKDLVSSLVVGLLTIGARFGGLLMMLPDTLTKLMTRAFLHMSSGEYEKEGHLYAQNWPQVYSFFT
ncbi:ATP-citrate synthase beta chain protein 1-like isoform X2 [Rhododendron vialii]|uniref:ATP-citrate synthase beta chain protein 1-like isoform X2 n=1 Tax=Rhododendron vialii TaxID=182163 RepID=UPI0026603A48|nr:ATP-citrate synthase beta chain protein 1-like isoform X2 [Rhododendron vialii]